MADRALMEAAEAADRKLFELSSVGIAHANPPTRTLVKVNAAFCALTGYSEHELLGMAVPRLTHPEDAAVDAKAFERLMRGELAEYVTEKRYIRKDGSVIWVFVNATVVRDGSGNPLRTVAMIQDISRRKRLEAELREASRLKDQYIATLAHELRNPLAPISNGVKLLRMAGDDSQQRARVLDAMERQLRHVVRLVDDLMDASRIQGGKFHVLLEPVELGQVVRHVIDNMQPAFNARGVRLDWQAPAELLEISGDSVRLDQLVSNVLANALKFTEAGGRVQVRAGTEQNEAVLVVLDDGIGIPCDSLESIFEPFEQVRQEAGRFRGGLGLGLHLARQLARHHGGDLRASSAGPGKGSEFTLTIPLRASVVVRT